MNGGSAKSRIRAHGGTLAADDAALVARIAAREEAALRVAIAAHARTLHGLAYRMIGIPQEAEDIVQESLLRLWDHAPRLAAMADGEPVRLGAWLKRVTVNLAIDRLRAGKRISGSISGDAVPERADDAPLADAQLVAAQTAQAARALIAALPERQRAAIILTYYEELPNAEAAEAMDLNIKAFESLLHRARAALRSAFVAQQQGGAA